ncbi:MAG TPA: hypothetical protein VKS60_18670 [Stellaceae bacterium]|nr:hypothetical protein [Stellaceae bacterium]
MTAGIGNRAALRALPRIGPSHRPPATILPELKVGRVDDPAELEADAVAERIMNARPPATSGGSRAAALRRKCDACENDELSRAPLGRGDLGGT